MTRLKQVIRSRPFRIYALVAGVVLALAGIRLGADYLDQRARFQPRLLSDPEFEALEQRMWQFVRAYEAEDVETIVSMLPPGYLQRGAERRERTPDWVRAAFRGNYQDLFADIEVTRASFDPTIWRTGEGRDGLLLAQVETSIGFETGTGPGTGTETGTGTGTGQRFMHYPVMAIRDDTEWWLLHMTSMPMRELLLEAYPDVAGLAETEQFYR